MSITVVIADDHHLVREAIRSLLSRHADINVLGEAANGDEAIALVKAHAPDVLLIDLAMPKMNGIEAVTQIVDGDPAQKVLAISSHTSQKWVIRALRAGVRGYVLKTETADNLGAAVRTVNKGGRWFSNEVGALIARLAIEPRLAAVDPLARLSHRQRTILQLIAEGRTNKEMSALLNISESTVDSHRTQLMRRLDVHDIAGLVRFAYQEGVIETE
jgi:DNA-binding NarL/FixJ family response regulator